MFNLIGERRKKEDEERGEGKKVHRKERGQEEGREGRKEERKKEGE